MSFSSPSDSHRTISLPVPSFSFSFSTLIHDIAPYESLLGPVDQLPPCSRVLHPSCWLLPSFLHPVSPISDSFVLLAWEISPIETSPNTSVSSLNPRLLVSVRVSSWRFDLVLPTYLPTYVRLIRHPSPPLRPPECFTNSPETPSRGPTSSPSSSLPK